MKRWITLILAVILTFTMAIPALAAPEEADFEYINQVKDVVFWVSWDVEKPDVVFIAPDGTEFDPMVESETTTTIVEQNDLYYVIMGAAAGQWRIRYDKGNNTTVEVSVHDYQAGVTIDSFSIGEVSGRLLPFSFTVSGEENTRFNYRISAMINHTGAEKELTSSYGYVGHEITGKVDLSILSTYSAYMLKLHVWYDDNGTDIFDFCFSDTFSFTNSDLDARAEDFLLTVMPEDELLYVSWPDISYNVEKVMVAVFEDGGEEPTVFDEYDPDVTDSVQLAYDPAAKMVDVEFTVTINGVNTAPVRKSLPVADFGIKLPEGDAFNTLVIPMTYSGYSKQLTDITINGYETQVVLDGDGSLSITLGDDWNELSICYTTDNNITWLIERDIYIDRVAPVLTMGQAYDGMSTESASISIAGTAMDCSVLTVNGTEIPLNNTSFSYDLELLEGANSVTVIAADKLGNESMYTAVIYRGTDAETVAAQAEPPLPGSFMEKLTGEGSYWILLIVSLLCVLVVVYALIFWRKEDKQ